VLVIDADLRRGELTEQLAASNGANPDLGLTGAVRGSTTLLSDVTRSSTRFRFSVVPSGKRALSPYEVLESPRLGELIAEARRSFGFVVIDTPPFVPFTDCRVLSRWVDGFILVVAAHRTPRKLLEETLNVIEPDKLLGLVFNGDDGPLWGTNRYYQYMALPQPPSAADYLPEPQVARITPTDF
jgi:Mrp family chromosome partitioning ATPase